MIVYRSQAVTVRPAVVLEDLCIRLRPGEPLHCGILELLIDFGALESGVVDAVSPAADGCGALEKLFRHASVCLGHAFCRSCRGERDEVRAALNSAADIAGKLLAFPLPEEVRIIVPEGYAYYGLYPETYLEASELFYREVRPAAVVCIGIRSIGTSLSAVVAARLEQLGVEVASFSVRPRGHAFDRRLVLAPELEARLLASAGAYFAVVDEGPGLSGSSMSCTARRLSELGIPEERIVFFPSWAGKPEMFLSEDARSRWRRHRIYTGAFESVWPESRSMLDLSAGAWRGLVFKSEADYPAVQPQHERRKYLREGRYLLKFAGLGGFGRWKLLRARQLAEAGFAPEPVGLDRGFLITEFVPGQPLRDGADPQLLRTMARYLAYLKSEPMPSGAVRFSRAGPDEILEMVRVNLVKCLGAEWLERNEALFERLKDAFAEGEPVAIDGRMLPHEWISNGEYYFKTDALDHGNDHFLPGAQDIAWDIAGACVEFDLTPVQQDYFLSEYRRAVCDPHIDKRLGCYRVAYLAFRLGYATLAANAIEPSPDAQRFRQLTGFYSMRLKRELITLED